MKIGFKIVLISAILILASCSQPKEILPEHSVESLNSVRDEIAPRQKPGSPGPEDPCVREFRARSGATEYGVKPSLDLIYDYVAKSSIVFDQISFLGDSAAFVSVAHPPNEASGALLESPFVGSVGGADIFYFETENGKVKAKNLGAPINTKTWDSHPYAISDDDGNALLVWASDRFDVKPGYSSPFQSEKRLTRGDTALGNSDIYYAFIKNGVVGEVKNFAGLRGDINSLKNDESPFIYCACAWPSVLFFASDRSGDYDIYAAEIFVDFDSGTIELMKPAVRLPKGRDMINTDAKEFFPFVPAPYEIGGKTEPVLYLSSDRYKEPTQKTRDTLIKNFGGFDIYKFDLPQNLPVNLDCRRPTIELVTTLLDAENPSRPVKSPKIEVQNFDQKLIADEAYENSLRTFIEPGTCYRTIGYSDYDEIECTGRDSVISKYSIREIIPAEPKIVPRDTVVEYLRTVGGRKVTWLDTTYSREAYPNEKIKEIVLEKNKNVVDVVQSGDSIIVTRLKIERKSKIEGGKEEIAEKTIVVYDTIPQFDTLYFSTKDFPALSERTKRMLAAGEQCFEIADYPRRDTVVYDTIFVWPRYYKFPPCRWEYVQNMVDYRKNVPYFQTAFWEVNTVRNYWRHLKLLETERYKDASYIELHDKNMYFGDKREGLSEEDRENRLAKRKRRIEDYRQYAIDVNKNLDVMAYEIAENVIPIVEEMLRLAPDNDNKLIIQIRGYSDIRPIEKGYYLGKDPVRYVAGIYDPAGPSMNFNKVNIAPGASMIGKSNEVLSQLRAYFGYREILKRLDDYDNFMKYVGAGKVLFPDSVSSVAEFEKKIAGARIVFLVKGRKYDSEKVPSVSGYKKVEGDYYELDEVRRINVIVDRVEYHEGRIVEIDCCTETPEPPTYREYERKKKKSFKNERPLDEPKKPVDEKQTIEESLETDGEKETK